MTDLIHMSKALSILKSGQKVDLTYVSLKGRIMECPDVVSLSYDHYKGTRTIKFLRSGQMRTIHDMLIIGLNGCEVYL